MTMSMSASVNSATDQASRNDSATAVKKTSCSFIVTGFGPFRGVPDNPTSVLIRRLRKDGGSTLKLKSNINIRETHILETAADYVREKIDDIYGRLESSKNNTNGDTANTTETGANGVVGTDTTSEANAGDEKKVIVVLHLGVNYRGKQFQLEECAYNDATFRIPDERGYQPHCECILESNSTASSELGKCFNTTLDLHDLCHELQEDNEVVSISNDPGRFDRCNSTNKYHHNGKEEEEIMHHTLFIHVPSFDVVSESRQLAFILKVMETIEQQISSGK